MASQATNAAIYKEYLQGDDSVGCLIRPSYEAEIALRMADEDAYIKLCCKAFAAARGAVEALRVALIGGPMVDGRRVFYTTHLRVALLNDAHASAAAELTKSPYIMDHTENVAFDIGGQSRAFYRQEVQRVLAELERKN
jgi:hypothetical protein